MGELIIRRKLKAVRDRCLLSADYLDRWAWKSEDDAKGKLIALRQLEIELQEMRTFAGTALATLLPFLDVAMEDFRVQQEYERQRLSEAERAEVDRLAEVIQLADRRAA